MDFAYDAAISYDFRVRILCPKAPNRTRSTQLIVMGSLPFLPQPFGVPTLSDRNHAIVAVQRPRARALVITVKHLWGDGRTDADGGHKISLFEGFTTRAILLPSISFPSLFSASIPYP